MAYKNKEDQLAAWRKHYSENSDKYKAKRKAYKDELRQIIRDAKSKPCTDCGVQYPYYVMQFDHLSDKSYGIATMINMGSKKKLLAEIAKCEVVCANCHAERTHSRLSIGGSNADFESVVTVGSIPTPRAE
jgi:hypothetical protein